MDQDDGRKLLLCKKTEAAGNENIVQLKFENHKSALYNFDKIKTL